MSIEEDGSWKDNAKLERSMLKCFVDWGKEGIFACLYTMIAGLSLPVAGCKVPWGVLDVSGCY